MVSSKRFRVSIPTCVRRRQVVQISRCQVTDWSFSIDPLYDVRKPKQDLRLCDRHIMPDQYTDPFDNEERWGYSVAGSMAIFRIRDASVRRYDGGTRVQGYCLARVQTASQKNRTRC